MNDNIMEESPVIDILGIKFDEEMNFKTHVRDLARAGASKLAALRRISPLLNAEGCKIVYESQVRPTLEFAPLTWMSCPLSHHALLDKLDERAQRMINICDGATGRDGPANILQHRRDVAGITVLYKATFLNTPWLTVLRGTLSRPLYATREAESSDLSLVVPRSRTSLHQRSFIPRMTRLWNVFVRSINQPEFNSVQCVKLRINNWLKCNNFTLYAM